jgi:alpha-1,3-rhamnosyltransferase
MVVNRSAHRPLVSVVISSYNHADYVEAAILSVLRQTYPRVELLVVDDGSTDASVERIRRLQAVHGFDFREQENQGLARTLNGLVARAQGELIAPFGSDDIMLPDRLEKQVGYMADKPEVGICAGNVLRIDALGRPLDRQSLHPRRRLDFEDVFLNRKPGAPAPTLLFRREALDAVGGFDPEIRLEDVYVELAIARKGYLIDVMQDSLAQYRMHDTNTYKNYSFMVQAMLSTLGRFADHPRYPEARSAYINSMFVKVAGRDPELGRWLLGQLPLSAWNFKTLRGLLRLGYTRRKR